MCPCYQCQIRLTREAVRLHSVQRGVFYRIYAVDCKQYFLVIALFFYARLDLLHHQFPSTNRKIVGEKFAYSR
jgi:hypothetical protein